MLLDQTLLDSINAKLTALSLSLGRIVAVEPVAADTITSSGANNDTHFKLLTENGVVGSLKASPSHANAARNERLVAEAAMLLRVDNARPILKIDIDEIGVLKNRDTNVIVWVPGAVTLDKQPDAWRLIQLTEAWRVRFLDQLGQWHWLHKAYGVTDRHLGNWAYSPAYGLVGIDYGIALAANASGEANQVLDWILQPQGRQILDTYQDNVSAIFHRGFQKVHGQFTPDTRKQLQASLQNAGVVYELPQPTHDFANRAMEGTK
jgi:hypothetical protein